MRLIIIAALSMVSFSAVAEEVSPAVGLTPTQSQVPAATDPSPTDPNYLRSEDRLPYRPCPASVVFPNGRHACLG